MVRIIEADNIRGEITYHLEVDGWNWEDADYYSPSGVGQDVGVIWGGIDESLIYNNLIRG